MSVQEARTNLLRAKCIFYRGLTHLRLLDEFSFRRTEYLSATAYQEKCMSVDDRLNTTPTLQKGGEPTARSPSVQANNPSGSQPIGPKRMLLVFALVIILPCVGLAIAVEILAGLVHVLPH